MKSKATKKPADEDEAKSKKIRSSRSKRRRDRHSRSRSPSSSGSDSPPRKRSKKPTKKVVDKKTKKNKGSSTRRRRRRTPSPSTSPSSSPSTVSRSRSHSRRSRHSSISASERSLSPLPRSHSKDTRKGKGRGRDRDKDRKRRRARRSRSYSSSPASSGSSQSRSRSKSKSRKRRAGGTRDDATRDWTARDYDNYQASWTERDSIENVYRDEEAVAVDTKGIDDYEKNVVLERRESSPSEDSKELGEILSPKEADATDEILPVGGGSPEVEEDLELILRQKALDNFRKFKEASAKPGNTDSNGTGKGVLTDSLENTSTKIAESRSVVTPSRMQGNSFGVGPSAGSPELEDFGNGTSPWNQEMSRDDKSPGIFEASDTSPPTQHQGSRLELSRPYSRIMSKDGRNGGSVMQRLGINPPSSSTVKQRLGSSAQVIPVQATRRVKSVVSIPVREGFDGSEFTSTPSENPAPVESSSDVRNPPDEINNLDGTNEDDRKTGEASASAPDSSVLSIDESKSQAGTDDKDGSQFEKRTFSRMHDGETVQVSYKVYIPTTSPRLARRKLQR